ncbi:amidohydrolase family protein [Candidatus Sumerlaeota bacterium]|nr:amidohydrolase family protein [Candidatus Sumerlaeota bacterium]
MSRGECPAFPGFVDLQVNGFRGVDFADPDLTEERFAEACHGVLQGGVAAFLPTVITCPLDVCRRNLSLIARAMRRSDLEDRVLGVHLEGPFISREPGYVGAHDPEHVHFPAPSLLEEMQAWADGTIRLLTMAAELPGAVGLAHCARGLGIAVSVGHSHCTASDLARLAKVGATALTHLGNGVPADLPRHDNPIWAGLACDDLTAMIIADGHHLPEPVIRVILRVKGADRTVVVSDLCPIAGLPPGEHLCFGHRVVLEVSGRVSLPKRGCLAASGNTMLEGMNHLASLGILSEEDLLAVGFHSPLRLIGADPARIRGGTGVIFDRGAARFTLHG